ncbi:MAG TPA: hypothetical protein VEV45_20135 [Streptosporangiaceae bacterium]|nr:hypothetical protein [Streptosporangiaceae bacterium]
MSARAKALRPVPRHRAARAEPETGPGNYLARWPYLIDVCLAAAFGLAVLVVHDVPYMLRHSFWLDEAWVADTVRAPIGLTRSLASSTPLGWTYLLRLVPFGGPERLRLVPLAFTMLAATAGYLLGRELHLHRYVTGILTGAAVLLSPAMLVLNDLKQYTAEACACLVLWVLVARVENEWRIRRLVAIAAVSSVGLLFANTVIFIGVAAMAALALECLVTRRYRQLLDVAAASAGMLIVSLAIYLTLIRPTVTPLLVNFWRGFYVPTGSGHAALSFVYERLVILAPYAGFGSLIVDTIGVIAGIAALIWLRRIALAALFPVTLGIVLVASAAGKYPFGDQRTSTFWLVMPPVLMAIAVGGAGRLASRFDRRAPVLVAAVALAAWAPATVSYVRSHTLPDEDAHAQVVYVDSHVRRGDIVLVGFKASYVFAYYYQGTPEFPTGAGPNGHVVAYPSRPSLVVLTSGTLPTIDKGLAEARAKIAAEPASARGRIWIIRSHQRPTEVQEWDRLLAGQRVQTIRVGPEPLLLYQPG